MSTAKEKNTTKKQLIILEPEAIPPLTKSFYDLDDLISTDSYANKLGTYAIFLNDLKAKSIYKKLMSDGKNKESPNNISRQNMREIRNKYLKKLVESNPLYFPKELGLNKYKKPFISKEEKFNKILKRLEEDAKKAKANSDLKSRKNSSNLMASRKESFLDNKRKRTDTISEENDNAKKKKGKEAEENDEERNNDEEWNNDDEEGNNGEASYNEEEEYANQEDDDSQNHNYSLGGGDDDDY